MLSELLIGASERTYEINPEEEIVALIILAVIFIILYIFREKRRKNKYEPKKKLDDPNFTRRPWDI